MKDQNGITSYIHSGYKKIGEYINYDSVCFPIASDNGPLVIGIDGPSNAGKTSIASGFITYYQKLHIPVSYLPLDLFMTERKERNRINRQIARGQLPISDYSSKGWDHSRYQYYLHQIREIIHQKKGVAQNIVIPSAYNRKSGSHDKISTISVSPDSIVITDGTGIHLYHEKLFDCKIRVDVSDTKTLLDRVVAREKSKPIENRLAVDYLLQRYQTTDVPHADFLRTQTKGMADFVIDTSVIPLLVYKKY